MFVIVKGKRIPVEQFEGSSVDEERKAIADHKARGQQFARSQAGNGSTMTAGTQFLRGDARAARKRFWFRI